MRKNRAYLFVGVASAAALSAVAGFGVRSSPAAPTPAASSVAAAAAPKTAHADARLATVTTFMNAHCVSCHGPTKKKADLVLHTYVDATSLVKGRKTIQQALEMVTAGEMPPEDKPQPTADEVEAFAEALGELYAEADKDAKPDPGRVTVRRLNRNEYNNTIRDLLGVAFTPADDFPADDIGHGFDNIGDVLTVSPVLMERYLNAAEAVAASTIVTEPPQLAPRRMDAVNIEPKTGRDEIEGRFRRLTTGAAGTTWNLTLDGEYKFKTRVYGRSAGDETPRAVLLLDGKEVASLDVTATDSKSAQTFEHTVTFPKAGEHKFEVGIANPSPDATAIAEAAAENRLKRRRERDEARAQNKPEPSRTDLPKVEGADQLRALWVEGVTLGVPTDTRPLSHRTILALADADAPQAEQTRQILANLTTRAYRRPATTDEVERLAKLVDETVADGEKWETGLQTALQALLVSPKFLFRLELDDRPEAADARTLDEYQLASRLSYFVWASMPDDELLALAEKKQLSAGLDAQVRRMLQDPRARSLVDNFAMQWLQLKRLKGFAPDTKQFPAFDEDLRAAMARETELFIEAVIKEDRSILDLLDADFTFLNEQLAGHYGITDTNGNGAGQPARPKGDRIPRDEFVRVSLAKGGARGGILTHASVLAVTSNPTRTSPVKRGKWVLEQILGAPPPPPPPDVPELEESGKAHESASLRQRLEEHRANPACASCHAKMDQLGFAFENFDAVGAFRQKDGKFPIDPSGILPDGSSFSGAGELRSMLVDKQKEQFTRTITEKLIVYALGRGLEHYDDRTVDEVGKAVAAGNYKFSRMVAEIVKSDPFTMRRGLEAESE